MTYVVTDNCIKCRYTDCVVVCPVDCFHVGENMLVINPDECIDCGVCEPECPAEAIKPESVDLAEWMMINKKYSQQWPVIDVLLKPMEDADRFNGVEGKFKKLFSANPGNVVDQKRD
jgi:ferredoxin